MLINSKYGPSDRNEMLRFITNMPTASLEIGCREGLFSKSLKEKFPGIVTWGVEPDESTQVAAKGNLDNAIHDSFPVKKNQLPKEHFDLIIFNDVLEHMYDPWEALEKCHSLLKSDGIIIASIPNIRHRPILRDLILHDLFEYNEAGNLDISHIRFFTKTGMLKLFEQTGYDILEIKPLKPITSPIKQLCHKLTRYKFESLFIHQYGMSAKPSAKRSISL